MGNKAGIEEKMVTEEDDGEESGPDVRESMLEDDDGE